ncbi:rhodanese-related sulfurtransferase [Sodalis sp. CWE]|nr:rhodanese-related sulfurtransferase [Sodalis sp. CWE]
MTQRYYDLLPKKEIKSDSFLKISRITLSFYHYFALEDPQYFRDQLHRVFTALHILGRIYVAFEGINAQISVPRIYFNKFRTTLYKFHPQLKDIRINVALENNNNSFSKLRLKVRKKILADGINDPNFNPKNVGYYLKAEEVNAMMADPQVLLIDVRNHYEYEIGHFDRAIEIPSNTFREKLLMVVERLKNKKDKKIILYCTGGIRCEKASAWMRYNGFKNVFQIDGGIIGYVRRAWKKKLPVRFIGKNFVFDERLSERVTTDIISHCRQCNSLCDRYVNCYNQQCNLLFIQCNICTKNYLNCCSVLCKEKIFFPVSLKERL